MVHSARDGKFLKMLLELMRPLLRNEFRLWIDCPVRKEMPVKDEVIKAFRRALNYHIVLYLVTPQTLAYPLPKQYWDELQRCAQKGRVIPIVVEDALWEEDLLLSELQLLPDAGTPILGDHDLDHPIVSKQVVQILREIANIGRALNEHKPLKRGGRVLIDKRNRGVLRDDRKSRSFGVFRDARRRLVFNSRDLKEDSLINIVDISIIIHVSNRREPATISTTSKAA